jgi:hypothetical protein
MAYGIEACALALLRAAPDVAVPLSHLHGALAGEAGAAVGGRGQLRRRLGERPDLFLLLDPRPAPWDGDEWPEALRQAYRDALSAAGHAPEAHVAPSAPALPAETGEGLEPVLRTLGASLLELWTAADGDAESRAAISDALGLATLVRDALERDGGAGPGT